MSLRRKQAVVPYRAPGLVLEALDDYYVLDSSGREIDASANIRSRLVLISVIPPTVLKILGRAGNGGLMIYSRALDSSNASSFRGEGEKLLSACRGPSRRRRRRSRFPKD